MIIHFITGFPVFPSPAEAMPFILKGSALLFLLKLTVVLRESPSPCISHFSRHQYYFFEFGISFCKDTG